MCIRDSFGIGSLHLILLRMVRILGVDNAIGSHPQPQNVTLKEHAAVLGAVIGFDALGQAQVVIHAELQVQQPLVRSRCV